MSAQTRHAKVFVVLLISITFGAIVLMTLGNNPPSAGAFCLSDYYQLEPVETVISSQEAQSLSYWMCIEICYSGTKAGNIEQIASLSGLANPEEINYHFVICNGLGGRDGEIQPTEKWQRQWSTVPEQIQCGSGQTIRICVITDGKTTPPTDFEVKRTEALAEALSRKFNIRPRFIYYPADWQ